MRFFRLSLKLIVARADADKHGDGLLIVYTRLYANSLSSIAGITSAQEQFNIYRRKIGWQAALQRR